MIVKFTKVDVKTFKEYKETKIVRVLNEFKKSDIAVAEITWEEGEYRNATSAYSAVKNAIKRMKLGNISVRVSDKRLYLINNIIYDGILDGGDN